MVGKLGEKPAVMRAAVFSLASKNLGGRANAPSPTQQAERGLITALRVSYNNYCSAGVQK